VLWCRWHIPCIRMFPDRTPTLPLRLIQAPYRLYVSCASGAGVLSSICPLFAPDLCNCRCRSSLPGLDRAPNANGSQCASIACGTVGSLPSLSTLRCHLGSRWGPPLEASRARCIGFSANKLLAPLQRGPHTLLQLMTRRQRFVSSNTN